MTAIIDISNKKDLRAELRTRRRNIHSQHGVEYSRAITENMMKALHFMPRSIITAYYPIGSEVNSRPIMDHLNDEGHVIALPTIETRDAPLKFRIYRSGDALEKGAFGLSEPRANMPAVIPDMLLIPGLGFDRNGQRLGYGTGFFDRTLEDLRRIKPIQAVMIAYSGQEVETIPTDDHDQKMNWIITEKDAIKIA